MNFRAGQGFSKTGIITSKEGYFSCWPARCVFGKGSREKAQKTQKSA
jgi:uncharacterized protein YbdZ (MbtH family)